MYNVTLSPAQTEIIAMPGASFTRAYDVTNNSDSLLVLTTSVLPWQPTGSDGLVNYENISPNSHFEFSLNNADLRLGQSFILRPRESRQLVLKIKSLNSTPLTDSYFTFFVNQDQSGQLNSDSSGGQVSARIGSHLLISTSDTEKINTQLTTSNLHLSHRLVDIFFPKITIAGSIKNDSDHYSQITGKLIITKNNKTITESELFPHNVLVHNSRDISCLSNDNPVTCTLSPPYWPGAYTATIGDISTNFYVFPFSILLFCLFIGSLIFLLLKRQKKS